MLFELSLRKSLAIGAALGCVAVSHAQSFINGNFETGDFTGWTVALTPNGQTTTQNVELFDIDGGGLLGINNAARFGVGRIDTSTPNGGVTLTQSMLLTANVTYTFTFMWASRNLATTAGSNSDGGQYDFIVDGVSMSHQAVGTIGAGGLPGETGSFVYGVNTATFTAPTTASYVVGARIFRAFTPPATLHQFVDNFNVSAVPEPATLAVFGLGLAALARKRRK
jgi:hypothetical protein